MEGLDSKLTQETKEEILYFVLDKKDSAQENLLNKLLEKGNVSSESFVKAFTERFKMTPNLCSEEKIKEMKKTDWYKENSVYKIENGLIKKIK